MGAIAIVGIACQFPGARDLAELHDLTVAGSRMFRPIPALPGRMLHAALLDGWTSPGGQSGSGRVHKLAAETIALALTDASARRMGPGLNGSHPDDEIGLFLAATASDAAEVARRETGIGTPRTLGAPGHLPRNRYTNSLLAVADACAALDAGLLDMALAGGVELGIDPRWLARRAAAGELGTCEMRVYDAEPVGVLPGDGCGIVVLMRSAEARAAELPVYAEIAGWATVPADPAPADLLSAYTQAHVEPGDSHLVEGHGLGTMAADLAELTALTRLRHGSTVTAALGAVSGNIGHARAAAGAASLLKTVAAMVAGTIPPGTGTVRPHPLIESNDAALRLPARPEPWPDGTRLAAVNSLGTADRGDGAVHLVLRREPDDASRGRRRRTGEAAKTTTYTDQRRRGESTYDPDRRAHGRHAAPGKHAVSGALTNGPSTPSAGPDAGDAPAAGRGWSARRALLPGGAEDGLPHARESGGGLPQSGRTAMAGATIPLRPAANGTAAGGRRGAPAGERDGGVARGRREATGEQRDRMKPEGLRGGAGGEPGGVGTIFALCGGEATAIAATLDVIAGSAGELTDAGLHDLARQLAAAAQRAADRGAPLRVTVTATTPGQLAAQARRAAHILRGGGSPVSTMRIEPGIAISAGATGTVCFVFPGLADSQAEHAAMLTGSLDGVRILGQLGVKATSAVGYSFGEITGLVWAGCLPPAEAARLAALRARVLYACVNRSAAMARVTAGTAIVQRLCARYGLHVAAYETPAAHLVAGPGTGIRDLGRCGAELGVTVDVLAIRGAPHSPAMASCAAPLRSVMGATDFVAPRRRLISTITGQAITPADDIAGLLAGQLARPVLFAQAMDVAARGADLLVVAGPEAGPASASSLTAIATAASGVPAIRVPGDWEAMPTQTVATLYAAGAIRDLTEFLTGGNRPARHAPPTGGNRSSEHMRHPERSLLPGHTRLAEGNRPPGPPRLAAAPDTPTAVPTPRRPEAEQPRTVADRRPVTRVVLPARGVRL